MTRPSDCAVSSSPLAIPSPAFPPYHPFLVPTPNQTIPPSFPSRSYSKSGNMRSLTLTL
ncbi:hypothetical protein N431DRAFT_437683 [Stipitochalara longipes BDJ]|nr:hypothetical protein N431DRAFT_437683 [Stipitochalara longipes BDJ]